MMVFSVCVNDTMHLLFISIYFLISMMDNDHLFLSGCQCITK